MRNQGLPRQFRIIRPADYALVFAERRSFRDGLLIAHIRHNNLPHSRMGTAVTKRGRTAIVRNHLRRILREAFRLERADLPAGLDLVLLPPRACKSVALDKTRGSLVRICRRFEESSA